ncbi:MAG: ribbon-helix-helix protein, CopG family [Chloroflexota bacterium]
MAKKGSRIQVGATLPTDLVDQLREVAKKNNRTVSAEMELAIRQYIEDMDDSQLPPELLAAVEKWYRDNQIG